MQRLGMPAGGSSIVALTVLEQEQQGISQVGVRQRRSDPATITRLVEIHDKRTHGAIHAQQGCRIDLVAIKVRPLSHQGTQRMDRFA